MAFHYRFSQTTDVYYVLITVRIGNNYPLPLSN